MNDYAGLRAALAAEGLTPGPWTSISRGAYWHGEEGDVRDSEGNDVGQAEFVRPPGDAFTICGQMLYVDADYIAAANPEVIAALLAERDALMADAERLSAFAYAVMGDWPDVGGLDGFDLQALGEKHGLLEKLERQAPCGEFCQCAEYETGTVECFRLTPMVLAARSKGKEGSE